MDLKASRQDAEGRLLRCGQLGCYIIRASKTLADKMALSVLVRPGKQGAYGFSSLISPRINRALSVQCPARQENPAQVWENLSGLGRFG